MFVDESIHGLRAHLRGWRQAGQTIALVPTMGNLHEGHLSLLKMAHAYADKVVVSIFVNPLQFDDAADLAAYPKTLEQDIQKLTETELCDLLFSPNVEVIYPQGMAQHTRVMIPGADDKLCGRMRPGHFEGVATVVTKLFALVQPDVAVFGEKDYQQLLLINKLTEDLNLPIKIIGAPTLRDDDGLAMSSRNQRLSPAQRAQAVLLPQQLQQIAQQLLAGETETQGLLQAAEAALTAAGWQMDYLEIRRSDTLTLADLATDTTVRILAAGHLGSVRLIDNLVVSLPEKS